MTAVVVVALQIGSRAEALAVDPPTELPLLGVEEAPLHADDVTLRPFTVGRSTWSGRTITTLKDTLAQAPGVLLQESFGGFEPPRLSIRGSGLQSAPSSRGVQFLLEGFPLTLADGSFNAALIDPQLLDRAEIFRGEAAARIAPAVMGGAINLRTVAHASSGSGLLRAETGSFGAIRTLLTGHTTQDSTVLNGAATFARQEGHREHNAQQRAGVFARLKGSISRGGETILSVYHVRADYNVPGPLTLAAAASDPRTVSADVLRDRPRRESSTTQLIAQTSQQNAAFMLEAGASWLHTEDWFRQLRGNGIADSRSDDLTFRGALERRFETASGEHLLRLGTTISRGWRELRRFENDRAAAGRVFGHDALAATTAALDLEATGRIRPTLTATAAVAGLFARRSISDKMSPGPGAATTSKTIRTFALQPRVQALWTPNRSLTCFVAVARTTEPPTFDDVLVVEGAPTRLTRCSHRLLDQRATTWEIGATGNRGPFGWDLTAYQGDWTNEILRLTDAQGLARGAVNAGPTRHTGVEAAFHWQLLEREHRLRLTTTATWNRFTFAGDPLFGRNRLAGAPRHLGSAQVLYEHRRGGFAAVNLDWIAGATPVDHAGRMNYGGRTLAHVRVGWRQGRRWTAFAEVRNVFDRAHIASTAGVLDLVRNPAATAVFLPGAPRSFAVGLELTH